MTNHSRMLFLELIHGKKYTYAIYLSEDGHYFLPVILDKLHASVLKQILYKQDNKDLAFVLPIYIFVFDLLRGLACRVDGIFLRMTNQSVGGAPTLEAVLQVSQSSEIGESVVSVGMVLSEATVVALLFDIPLMVPENILPDAAVHIPISENDKTFVMNFIRDEIVKFDIES